MANLFITTPHCLQVVLYYSNPSRDGIVRAQRMGHWKGVVGTVVKQNSLRSGHVKCDRESALASKFYIAKGGAII